MDKRTAAAALKYARGHWQKGIVYELLAGHAVNPLRELRGYARAYSLRYRASLLNLFGRLEDAGFKVDFTAGPRGGEWGGYWRLRLEQ